MADDRSGGLSSPGSGSGWRRGLNVLGGILLLLAVLLFVSTAVPQVVGADHSYVVLSGSMQPTMSPGDVIFVRDVEPGAIEAGDILTFERDEETTPTTHRVVEVVERDGQRAFRMKGDANEDPDHQLVEPSHVEGQLMSIGGVLFVIPAIGYVIHFANTPFGFTVLVLLPIAAVAASELWSLLTSVRSGADRPERSPAPIDAPSMGPADGEPMADEEDVLVRLRPGELRLGLGILVAFTAYAVLVAYLDTAAWSVGMAVAVGITTLLFWALYRSGGDGESPDDTTESQGVDPGRSLVRGRQGVDGRNHND